MTLLEKLSAITTELGSLSKTGTNAKFNYSYVKGEDAMKEFRALEIKHKIKVLPVTRENSLTIVQKESGLITTFVVDYKILDLESPETLTVSIPVQGFDSTDKGVYKALTGGFKYFLLQTFSYSSDDPEIETGETSVSTASSKRFATKPTTGNPFVKSAPVAAKAETVTVAVTGSAPTGFSKPTVAEVKVVPTNVVVDAHGGTTPVFPKATNVMFKKSVIQEAIKKQQG